MYFEIISIWLKFWQKIWLTNIFFLLKQTHAFHVSKMVFFLIWSLILSQSLLLRIELPKCIPSILGKDWDHIIFYSLSVLFSYVLARGAQFFEKIIFELEAFSYSFKMTLSLAKQLILPRKMVVSSAKFIILISWSPFCTPLIPCHYQLNGRLLWPKQHSNMEDGHPYQAVKRSER